MMKTKYFYSFHGNEDSAPYRGPFMTPIRTASSRRVATRRAPQRATSRPRKNRGLKRFCVVVGGLVCVIGACAAFSAPFKLYENPDVGAPKGAASPVRPLFSRGDGVDPYYASVNRDCLTGAGVVVDPHAPASTLNVFSVDDSAVERRDAYDESLADSFDPNSPLFFANTGATIIPDAQGAQFADLPLPDPTVDVAADLAVDFGSDEESATWREDPEIAEIERIALPKYRDLGAAWNNGEFQIASQLLENGKTLVNPLHENRMIALTAEETSQAVRLARAEEEENDARVQPLSDVPIPREPQNQTRVTQAGVVLAPSGYRRAGTASGASPTGVRSIGEAKLVF